MHTLADYWRMKARREALRAANGIPGDFVDDGFEATSGLEDDFGAPRGPMDRPPRDADRL